LIIIHKETKIKQTKKNKTMKKTIVLSILGLLVFASSCGGEKANENQSTTTTETTQSSENTETTENPSYDVHRGEGKFTEVAVDEKLYINLAQEG
jgi:hypothetical protein